MAKVKVPNEGVRPEDFYWINLVNAACLRPISDLILHGLTLATSHAGR